MGVLKHYEDNEWKIVSLPGSIVKSINGQSGDISLNADDVNALSKDGGVITGEIVISNGIDTLVITAKGITINGEPISGGTSFLVSPVTEDIPTVVEGALLIRYDPAE